MYVELDRSDRRSLARQIYLQIRLKIMSGEFRAGEKLSSTRELSKELNVARNTVLSAYDMLAEEGLVETAAGSGTRVKVGEADLLSLKKPRCEAAPQAIQDYQVSAYSSAVSSQYRFNLDSGIPDLHALPRDKWAKAAGRVLRDTPDSLWGYDDPRGRPEFRQVLADYLSRKRGIRCSAEQILVTSGTKQALALIAKCLLNSNSTVLIEEPSNENVRRIFSYHTDRIIPLTVDRFGIETKALEQQKSADLIFTTPSHQFPMGGILPMERRIDLIHFAQKQRAYVLEDDYDSEFQYGGPPLHSLWELDPDRVIYCGTFSKVLFPALRTGYVVLPSRLMGSFSEWKRLSDHNTNPFTQLTLARFIESGDLERHIRRMAKSYRKKRDLLFQFLSDCFGNQIEILGGGAGMHAVVRFNGIDFDNGRLSAIAAAGIYVVPVEHHAMVKGFHRSDIIIGYAQLQPDEMEAAIFRLKEVLEKR